MNLFNVYPLFDIEPVKAKDCYIWDQEGNKILDLYGGHAVISIGHSHPHYVQKVSEQLGLIGFYSNSVQNSLQKELAEKLGELSGYPDHELFLCNSGAEAMENALKLASFHTDRKKIVMLSGAFHGRTSGAVAITDNPKIQAPVNPVDHVIRIDFDDEAALEEAISEGDVCAVVIEGMQGVGGVFVPSTSFLQKARSLCDQYGTVLIMDEIQSGYGRSGKFFAHQHAGIEADLITLAKGMGNGFPIGGVMIAPKFESWFGMLGTTFGGNHLACAAGIAVLDVLKEEKLIEHAAKLGDYLKKRLQAIPGIQEIRGHGLMLGMQLNSEAKPIRLQLLKDHKIFTGSSAQKETLRLLPPLTMTEEMADEFLYALQEVLNPAIA
ncbi:MAG: aspartate aminotransferase family protein [Bacteroidia bacterium]|nr:aspartate aminotransferase family protein [Bacteroidia bacterium]